MRKRSRIVITGLLVLLLLFVGAVVAALAAPAAPTNFDLSWQVLAGGGSTMSSSSFMLMSTTGQPVAGPASSASYSLMSGYWQSFQELVRTILLPIILG
ncbi:MAG: hypothetical protein R6X18_15795 [Chloroflexota bacterium]|jgi:hypothetical protein